MRWKIIAVLPLFLVFSPIILDAANPSELEQQIERVKQEREVLLAEQKKLQAEIEIINKETRTIGGAIKSLNVTRQKLASDIRITQSRITSADLTVRSLESTMGDKERQIIIHRKALADILSALSEYDARPLALNLLANAGLSGLWRDRSQIEDLNNRLGDEIGVLRETRKVLNQEKERKEKIKEEQISLQGQLRGQQSVVEVNRRAKERLLADTKSEEAEYQKLLAENIANQKQFEEDLFKLESELRITLDPSLIPLARHGLLSWPLDSVVITQRFGDTAFARSGAYKGKGHNGIDFRATMGTAVKAMLSGTVEGTGNTDEMNAQLRREGQSTCGSYGRWVLIKHYDGLSSIYAHLSASIVKIGQSVKTGEIIGYSGGTPGVNGSGYSTGQHLHVGLFASQGVQIRQFTTSINCKHTFVPIADLKAYLDPLAYLPTL